MNNSSFTLHTFPSPALRGTAVLPGDKSISHRAILFAALAEGESRVENLLVSGVTRAMLDALTAVGVPWMLDGTTLTVQGRGRHGWRVPAEPINCGNSATTMRLLAGALAAAGVEAVLDGSAGLRRRPMGRIVHPLQQMGVNVTATNGCAPLILGKSDYPLTAVAHTLPIASAQVKSCLLLAGLAANGPVTLIEPGPSRDHTERMLQAMGVQVETWAAAGGERSVTLHPPEAELQPLRMTVPGDVSAAAFLLVAALIVPGSQVTLTGVELNPTRTGLLDALRAMGADIAIGNAREVGGEPVGDLTIRAGELHGVEIGGDGVVRMIDEFPIFAVAAALAQGQTVVREATELRHKESDRITALCQQLQAVGADVQELADGFVVNGRTQLHGGVIDPHGDHRLAMSLAVAGLRATNGVTVQNAQIIHESFPDFAAKLAAMGASVGKI